MKRKGGNSELGNSVCGISGVNLLWWPTSGFICLGREDVGLRAHRIGQRAVTLFGGNTTSYDAGGFCRAPRTITTPGYGGRCYILTEGSVGHHPISVLSRVCISVRAWKIPATRRSLIRFKLCRSGRTPRGLPLGLSRLWVKPGRGRQAYQRRRSRRRFQRATFSADMQTFTRQFSCF